MKCTSCDTEMAFLGQIPVRVGGTSGGWHFLVGEWAHLSEDVMPLDVYRCGACKRVEFFDLDLSLPQQ